MKKTTDVKICIKCKKPESEEIYFAVNPRTGLPNRSCEPCLIKTRVFQRELQKKAVAKREAKRKAELKPWDGIPWPATLL